MANKIMKFHNEQLGNVRGIYYGGQAWFVAKDVCACLELTNVTKALYALEDDEKMTLTIGKGQTNVSTLDDNGAKKRGGARMYSFINEPGLYRLVFASRMPKARELQHWVFHEILPKLRRQAMLDELRDETKDVRLFLTDTVKKFVEYLKERGELDRNPVAWYSQFSNLANKAAGVEKGNRDNLTVSQALKLQDVETAIAEEIERGMQDGKAHHDIWVACQEKVLK